VAVVLIYTVGNIRKERNKRIFQRVPVLPQELIKDDIHVAEKGRL
jgi:hypothetical protein